MTHSDLLAAIQLEFSHGSHCRLLRANCGRGWTGKVVHQTPTLITLSPYRPFHGMPEGTLDLIGWTRDGKFVAIDGKTARDRVRPGQQAFIDTVIAAGGLAGVARSVEEARNILIGKATI